MAEFKKNRFASARQDWETPPDLFAAVHARFQFTRDAAASAQNAKLPVYWTEADNCLTRPWEGRNWLNPPYNRVSVFVKKAFDERDRALTVCLIPARTNTVWWHKYCMKGGILFVQGRPRFGNCDHGLPQPLALVVFGDPTFTGGIMASFNIERKDR